MEGDQLYPQHRLSRLGKTQEILLTAANKAGYGCVDVFDEIISGPV